VTPSPSPEYIETVHSSSAVEPRPLTAPSTHLRMPSRKAEEMQKDTSQEEPFKLSFNSDRSKNILIENSS
ncbi:unnamed protein product, partial [Rotaria sp. Silwood1]